MKILKGRIICSHFKDRLAIGKETLDQPFGAGVSDIRGVLDEFKAQGFIGNISIEYEIKWENSLPDVAQCVGFFRATAVASSEFGGETFERQLHS